MANQEQLRRLKSSTSRWNKRRYDYPNENIDLSGADLSGTDLSYADLSRATLNEANLKGANLKGAHFIDAILTYADLSEANLSYAHLIRANLRKANLNGANFNRANFNRAYLINARLDGAHLSEADLSEADLCEADLSGADLSRANLSRANLNKAELSKANLNGTNLNGTNLIEAKLYRADLSGANLNGVNLTRADLSRASLIETNFTNATLTDCIIYGISAWNVQLEKTIQKNLIITQKHEPVITVDNLKVAQFIYLMLNNKEIRDVINTLTTKSVLILGRFTLQRKAVLDILRDALRAHNYLPILFDFEKPSSRNFTETIRILAHLSRFIIADLSEPRSIPQELQAIIPLLRVPIKPLLSSAEQPYSMFEDFDTRDYHWVLPIYQYTDLDHLLTTLKEQVIDPAESKACELEKR